MKAGDGLACWGLLNARRRGPRGGFGLDSASDVGLPVRKELGLGLETALALTRPLPVLVSARRGVLGGRYGSGRLHQGIETVGKPTLTSARVAERSVFAWGSGWLTWDRAVDGLALRDVPAWEGFTWCVRAACARSA